MAKNSKSDKAERRAAAARFAQEQKRKERLRTIAFQASIGLFVVAIVVGVTIAVLSQRNSSGDSPMATPPGLTDDGGIRFGAADAPVTLQAVEDFQCPTCQQFEQVNGDLLKSYREGDQVAVEYRPIAFLDQMSSTQYSTRALNASMCVLDDAGPDAWIKYHEALYANQPPERSDGLPDSQLESMASDAGATGSGVATCIADRTFGDWAAKQTEETFKNKDVTGTPTLFVNGTKLDGFDPTTIQQAVAAAGAK